MKKVNSILVMLLSATMLFGCGANGEVTTMVHTEETDTSSADTTVEGAVVSSTENTVVTESG